MKITYVDAESLIEHRRNPKPHDERQVEHIRNSIDRFGWTQPIVVDEANTILIGHGRKRSAEGAKVPVYRIEGLSEEQKLALMLVDNTTNQETGLDPITVEKILQQMEEAGIGIEDFGLVMETLGSDTERKQDTNVLKELYERYLNGETKRLVLYYDEEEHDLVSARIDRLIKIKRFESKGELIIAMLSRYKGVNQNEE